MKNTHNSLKGMMSGMLAGAGLMLAAAGPAQADTVSASAGPILLPNVPVSVCINSNCTKTPDLGSVSIGVSVTVDNIFGVLPVIAPSACPYGQTGLALSVTANTRNTTVSVTVNGTVGALAFSKPVGPVVVDARRTVTISACTF